MGWAGWDSDFCGGSLTLPLLSFFVIQPGRDIITVQVETLGRASGVVGSDGPRRLRRQQAVGAVRDVIVDVT